MQGGAPQVGLFQRLLGDTNDDTVSAVAGQVKTYRADCQAAPSSAF
jgi:hypothetical protein